MGRGPAAPGAARRAGDDQAHARPRRAARGGLDVLRRPVRARRPVPRRACTWRTGCTGPSGRRCTSARCCTHGSWWSSDASRTAPASCVDGTCTSGRPSSSGVLLAALALAGPRRRGDVHRQPEPAACSRATSRPSPPRPPRRHPYPCPPAGALPVAANQITVKVFNATTRVGLAGATAASPGGARLHRRVHRERHGHLRRHGAHHLRHRRRRPGVHPRGAHRRGGPRARPRVRTPPSTWRWAPSSPSSTRSTRSLLDPAVPLVGPGGLHAVRRGRRPRGPGRDGDPRRRLTPVVRGCMTPCDRGSLPWSPTADDEGGRR